MEKTIKNKVTLNVKFKHWNCLLEFDRYRTGGTAIKLVNALDEDIATATAWIPGIPDGHVAIKDYSGMLSALMEAGVVSKPVQWKPSGFVMIPVCKLLVNPEDH